MAVREDLLIDPLRRMPEWCVYVELPQDFEPARFAFPDGERYAIRGFFAHLDFARRRPEGSCPEELLFLTDLEKLDGTANMTATNVRLPLSGRTVRGCLRAVEEGAKPREKERAEASGATRFAETFARPFVTLLLHLYEKNSEVVTADGSEARPGNPPTVPGKKKGRTRPMAVEEPMTWEVGWQSGARVRTILSRTEADGEVRRTATSTTRAHSARTATVTGSGRERPSGPRNVGTCTGGYRPSQ